jgi:IclR family transcriptional regulator, pca regulon regulatory protein
MGLPCLCEGLSVDLSPFGAFATTENRHCPEDVPVEVWAWGHDEAEWTAHGDPIAVRSRTFASHVTRPVKPLEFLRKSSHPRGLSFGPAAIPAKTDLRPSGPVFALTDRGQQPMVSSVSGPPKRSRTFVTAFARGLGVIEAFGPDAARLTLSEVAARAGVDRSVARRLLLTLVELGLATTDGKQFELTPRVLRLANSYLSAAGFDSAVQSYLDELSLRIAENVSITTLDFPDVVNVARSEAKARDVRMMINVSGRLPAPLTASGRLLMSLLADEEIAALLDRIEVTRFTEHTITDKARLLGAIQAARRDGFAVVTEELAHGYVAASVPVRNRRGRVVAALNISSHTLRVSPQAMAAEMVPVMQDYAARIGAVLR